MRIGGTFAPPLSDELLAHYRSAIESMPYSAVAQALDTLWQCCAQWWELPESNVNDVELVQHASGVGVVVPLQAEYREALYEAIPWEHELTAIQQLFDTLPQGEVRNMAFHLLWHVKELNLDREPLTNDKL